MSVEIISEHPSPLLGRRDAKLIIHHEGSGTPDRLAVRKIVADHFKIPQDKAYVRSVQTRTGGSSALCEVQIYDDPNVAEGIVPAYIRNRNLPPAQRVSRKKGEEEKTPAAPTKPVMSEKKAEAPKPAPGKETAKDSKPAPAEQKAEPKAGAKTEAKSTSKAPTKPESKPKS